MKPTESTSIFKFIKTSTPFHVGLIGFLCILILSSTSVLASWLLIKYTSTTIVDTVSKEIKHSINDIGIKTPPTNDQLFTNTVRGLGVTENVVATSQVGTTAASAFATDLTTAQQTNATTQEIVVTNRDDTDNLCFKPIAWASAGANCSAKCVAAAATISCPAPSAAGTTATDGTVTPPGSSWPRRYDGTSCICIVGSAANTAYQTERVIR